jgi:hypothetical protein
VEAFTFTQQSAWLLSSSTRGYGHGLCTPFRFSRSSKILQEAASADDNEHEHPISAAGNDDESDQAQTETIQRLEKQLSDQKRQIDTLMHVMKTSGVAPPSSQSESDSPPQSAVEPVPATTSALASVPGTATSSNQQGGGAEPLKAMLFIDGTWLYYSLFTRSEQFCPVTRRFGKYWYHYYYVDWNALPRLICQQLQKQHAEQGWYSLDDNSDTSANGNGVEDGSRERRGVEITRACVYTSYTKTTDQNSLRVRMFEQMKESHYDVHIMETIGLAEKCVDIQLAVEMLHYATIGNTGIDRNKSHDAAYDVAILLSGDKDFIPALVRTRQKGKRTAVVSIRTGGCNRALVESPHVKDYPVIWMDDFLDQFIFPRTRETQLVSSVTMMKVILDFIDQSGSKYVSSRDIGRHLKNVEMGDGEGGSTTMLQQLKDVHGGLRVFLQVNEDMFQITGREADVAQYLLKDDPSDRSFLVSIADLRDARENKSGDGEGSGEKKRTVYDILDDVASNTTYSKVEQEFLEAYDPVEVSREGFLNYIPQENNAEDDDGEDDESDGQSFANGDNQQQPQEVDYSAFKVSDLKDLCRKYDLPVSGTKIVLLDRLRETLKQLKAKATLKQLKAKARKEAAAEATSTRQQSEQQYTSTDTAATAYVPNQRRTMARPQQTQMLSRPQQRQPAFSDFSAVSNEYPHIRPPTLEQRGNTNRPGRSFNNNGNQDARLAAVKTTLTKPQQVDVSHHLDGLISEYITVKGGQTGSRDMGRFLAANGGSKHHRDLSALSELKDCFGSLATYIGKRPNRFLTLAVDRVKNGDDYGFPIRLKQ